VPPPPRLLLKPDRLEAEIRKFDAPRLLVYRCMGQVSQPVTEAAITVAPELGKARVKLPMCLTN
jgi:hypothetical protein